MLQPLKLKKKKQIFFRFSGIEIQYILMKRQDIKGPK